MDTRIRWIARWIIATALLMLTVASCCCPTAGDSSSVDYRQEMRDFVITIAMRARETDPQFIVIPQNGNDLITLDGEPSGSVAGAYVEAIDGVGREDLFYGYTNDNQATPADVRASMLAFLDLAEAYGVEALVTDYCTTPEFVDDSYSQSEMRGYVSFAADRNLNSVPTYPSSPHAVHGGDVTTLSQAKNFLYLLDPSGFASRAAYLEGLQRSDHDLLIIDAYAPDAAGEGASFLGASEVASLRTKARGGGRLVVAYMSIGEAEDYRPYWDDTWLRAAPEWLDRENPDWRGNYKVRYWMESWQDIIFVYLNQIVAAGFDGVYLDIIDAFEYYEE